MTMAKGTTAGLTLHSNFARHWAASRRENPIAHAERTMAHVEMATALGQAHYDGVQEHLLAKEERWL